MGTGLAMPRVLSTFGSLPIWVFVVVGVTWVLLSLLLALLVGRVVALADQRQPQRPPEPARPDHPVNARPGTLDDGASRSVEMSAQASAHRPAPPARRSL